MRSYPRIVVAVLLLSFWSSFALAISYCGKPNGLATRDIAHEMLASFFELMNSRIAADDNLLYIINVPPELQTSRKFVSRESHHVKSYVESQLAIAQSQGVDAMDPNMATLIQVSRGVVTDELTKQGVALTDKMVDQEVARQLPRIISESNQKTLAEIAENGYVYLFSRNTDLLEGMGGKIAAQNGLVIEGEKKEIEALLSGTSEEGASWWKNEALKDASGVVAVGFLPPVKIREWIGDKAPLLQVHSWSGATELGLKNIKELLDVSVEDGVVFNLLPTQNEHAKPWKFSEEKSELYAENGRILSDEFTRLGYTVFDGSRLKSSSEVLGEIKKIAESGKKVLVAAETSVVAESPLLRIPGVEGGISPAEFDAIGPRALSNVFLLSCNSNLMSDKLGFSLIGTITTDQAKKLFRMTFAHAEKDRVDSYIEFGQLGSLAWVKAISEISHSLLSSGESDSQSVDGLRVGTVYVYKLEATGNPITVNSQEKDESSDGSDEGDNQNKEKMSAWIIFLIGMLGAVCREVFRWKALYEKNRHKKYMRPVYCVITLVIVVVAGCAAMVFATLSPANAFDGPIAFVLGVGLDKLVKIAAGLKIWIPSVNLGGVAEHEGSLLDEHLSVVTRYSVLTFLRH